MTQKVYATITHAFSWWDLSTLDFVRIRAILNYWLTYKPGVDINKNIELCITFSYHNKQSEFIIYLLFKKEIILFFNIKSGKLKSLNAGKGWSRGKLDHNQGEI